MKELIGFNILTHPEAKRGIMSVINFQGISIANDRFWKNCKKHHKDENPLL